MPRSGKPQPFKEIESICCSNAHLKKNESICCSYEYNHMHKLNFISQPFEILFKSTLGIAGGNHTYLKTLHWFVALMDA